METPRPFSLSLRGENDCAGTAYFIGEMYPEHHMSLALLEGHPLQRVIGPGYLVVGSSPLQATGPRPVMRDLTLALIRRAPSVSLEELCAFLNHELRVHVRQLRAGN